MREIENKNLLKVILVAKNFQQTNTFFYHYFQGGCFLKKNSEKDQPCLNQGIFFFLF